jgi:hypothetical protein
VEFHLTRIYRKLDIHSRSELVRRVVESETATSIAGHGRFRGDERRR